MICMNVAPKFQTDKYASGLIEEYESMFAKSEKVKYLEIGIWKGGSLRWAADYFHPQSLIAGIDRELPYDEFPKNIVMHMADQSDEDKLKRIAGLYHDIDIVIDDGCHFAKETGNTWNAFWPRVRQGGIYIIEDWGAAYCHKDKEQYEGMPKLITALMLLKQDFNKITNMKIVHNDNGMSYAAFWKG